MFFLDINIIYTRKIIAFWPNLPLANKKVPCESNPIPYPEYFYLSISAFVVNFTAPNRRFYKAKSKLSRFELDSETMYIFTILP